MFVSFRFIYVQYDNDWTYELTDSEFGTVSGINKGFIWRYIIEEYSKRNLNVAANLAIALVWYNNHYPFYSIQDMIDENKKIFQQYEEDLQKYLLLL